MRILVLVNVMDSDEAGATTYRLAADCVNLGHEVWISSPGNFSYDPEDKVLAYCRSVPAGQYRSAKDFLDILQGRRAVERWVTVDELDVLLLRNNPSVQKPWAQAAGSATARWAQLPCLIHSA